MDYKQSAAAVFVQQNAALLHTHAELMNITHSSFMDLNNLEEKDHFLSNSTQVQCSSVCLRLIMSSILTTATQPKLAAR